MKRIICTVTNDLTYDQRMIRICSTLASEGYSVLLLGRELPSSRPLVTQNFEQKRFHLFFKKGKLFYFEINIRLFFYLLFSRVDIVYSVDLDTLLPGRLIAKLRNKVCVFDAHEYFTELPELIERPFTKQLWELAAKYTIPRLKYAITVCKSLAEVFENKYGVHFKVVRNLPVPQNKVWEKSNTGQPFTIIYQGALNDGRGLEESILAMKILEDAVLLICGEGDMSLELRDLVTKNGLEKQVNFLGKLPPNELVKITCQADLGLNLLKNKGFNYYYSLANKAFDYVQAGLPSLNMSFPEYLNINQEFNVFYLIKELDPNQIAAAVEHLRSDKKAYATLANNCRKAAQVLNWQQESKKLLALINAIE
ncbi:MAG: glycosyltransferase [Bacteroidetes bacterium]|nr:glycosyltransferase [Bacteroidota bacterium]